MSSISALDDPVPIIGAGPTGLTTALGLLTRGEHCVIYDKAEGPQPESRSFTLHPRTEELVPECVPDWQRHGRRGKSMDYRFAAGRAPRPTAIRLGGVAAVVVAALAGIAAVAFLTHRFWTLLAWLPVLLTAAAAYELTERRALAGKTVRLDFSTLADTDDTRYPHVLIVNQNETEQVLRERVLALGGRIRWQRELVSATTDPAGHVVATLRDTASGELEEVRHRFLVGCDGVYSAVRRHLGIEFTGEVYSEQRLQMMNTRLSGLRFRLRFGRNRIHYLIHERRMLLIAYLGRGMSRVLVSNAAETGQVETTRAAFQQIVDVHIPDGAPTLGEPEAAGTFWLARRQSAAYQDGDGIVFVAGDAARTQSVIGGQGMNVSMQDGVNLGWKLALALRLLRAGRDGDARTLLRTYAEERVLVGKEVLAATHRLHQVIMGHDIPLEQRLAAARGSDFHTVVRQVAGMTYHYRDAVALPADLTQLPGDLAAGDRAPDTEITSRLRVYDVLSVYFTLLVFHRDPSSSLPAEVEQAARRYGSWLRPVVIAAPPLRRSAPPGAIVAEHGRVFDLYGDRADSLCLVRPDRYVAVRCGSADAPALFAMIDALLPTTESVVGSSVAP